MRSRPSGPCFVGHDWGAAVVYRAAALAPDRVRAVCAVAIPHPNLIKPSPEACLGRAALRHAASAERSVADAPS